MKSDSNTNITRIAQIVGKWNGGGVESVLMSYYKNIDRSKVQFDFICDQDSINIPYTEIEKLGGRIILVPPYQNFFSYQKELFKIFKQNQYRIVHSHINNLSVFPLRIAKKAKIPVRIAHSHSTSNKHEWKKNLVKTLLKPFSKIYATDYFACSELAGRYLFGNKSFNQRKVTIINNAIDIDKFKLNAKNRKEEREKLGLDKDTVVIGHIGRFVAQKNHSFLVDIFKSYHQANPNSLLVLAGQGPLLDKVKAKVNKLGLEKSVKFLGQVKDTEKLYQIFDLFLLPSLYEGLPVVGLEAQAAGLPVIFSDTITKEISISDSAIFVKTNLPSIYSSKIDSLLKSNPSRTQPKLIFSYGINQCVQKLEKLYLEKSKKRILHLVSTDVFSGAENVACQIINQTNKLEDYTSIYCSPLGANANSLHNRHIPHLVVKKFNPFYVRKAIKNFRPDIIHAHDIKASIIASLFRKKQIISHIHGNHDNMRNFNLKTSLFYLSSRNFSKIIWVSKSSLEQYFFKKKILNKSVVLQNIIDPEKTKEMANKKSQDYEKFDIIFLGRLIPIKDPIRILKLISEAKKEIPNIRLAMIGDGELKSEIQQYIKKNNLTKNVRLFGFLENPYGVLSNSKILVMTSIYEGTPIAALEAMSLGKPIVSTPTDGLVDIVADQKTGFLSSDDKVLVNSIIKILKDPTLYQNFSDSTKQISNEINNPVKYFENIKGYYEKY